MTLKNKSKLAENTEDPKEEKGNKIIILSPPSKDNYELRQVKLFGELTEDKTESIVEELLSLANSSEEMVPANPDDPECQEQERIVHPINFLISTYGGNADDMFGIYDVIKSIQNNSCPVNTVGIGKVMSAGVLLLASGTKGNRKIGRNTRVMIHHVAGGIEGTLPSMEADLESIKKMEAEYLNIMASETKFTKRNLQKLLDKKVNIYLSAEEAIGYGIADGYI